MFGNGGQNPGNWNRPAVASQLFLLHVSPWKLPFLMKKSIFILKKSFYGLMYSRNKLFSHRQNILSWTNNFCRRQYFFACAICPDKIYFVLDKIQFVQENFFCLRQNVLSMAKKFISAIHISPRQLLFLMKQSIFAQKKSFLRTSVQQKWTFYPWTKYFVSDKKFLSQTN